MACASAGCPFPRLVVGTLGEAEICEAPGAPMLEVLELTNVGPAQNMTLKMAPRINVITGDNGLGKSFLLDIVWWALAHTWTGEPVRPAAPEGKIRFAIRNSSAENRYFFRPREQQWDGGITGPIRAGERVWTGLTLYARIDGGFAIFDPARHNLPGGSGFPNRSYPHRPAYRFSRQEIWEGLRDGGKLLCRGLIDDWVLWQRSADPAFDQLSRVLEHLSPDENETLRPGPPTRLGLNDIRDVPTLEMPYGRVPLTLASSAVQRVAALGYLLVWAWKEHLRAAEVIGEPPERRLVFLVDEIEAHLHPRWQRVILPALTSVAGALSAIDGAQVQLVATTHAPMVLASLEPLFDPEQDALFHLALTGNQVELRRDEWHPRGDASSWLTSDVFEIAEARSLPAEQAIQKAMAAVDRPDLPLGELRRIHHELHGVLKDTDPFWVRWRYRAELAGLEP